MCGVSGCGCPSVIGSINVWVAVGKQWIGRWWVGVVSIV